MASQKFLRVININLSHLIQQYEETYMNSEELEDFELRLLNEFWSLEAILESLNRKIERLEQEFINLRYDVNDSIHREITPTDLT